MARTRFQSIGMQTMRAWGGRKLFAVRTWMDRRYDSKLGIDTVNRPRVPLSRECQYDDSRGYEALSYGTLRRILRVVPLTSDDVVVDIGSGMGRILCYAARCGPKCCLGIEVAADLVERSRVNASRLASPHAPITVEQRDAALADYTEGTVFFIFYAFGEQTLQAVLDRIHASIVETPRNVTIVYISPWWRHEGVLRSCTWLRCTARHASWIGRLTFGIWVSREVASADP